MYVVRMLSAHIAVHLETWHRSISCGGAGQNKGFVKEVSLEFLEQKMSQALSQAQTHTLNTHTWTCITTARTGYVNPI